MRYVRRGQQMSRRTGNGQPALKSGTVTPTGGFTVHAEGFDAESTDKPTLKAPKNYKLCIIACKLKSNIISISHMPRFADGERIGFVGGMAGTVAFERACRLEVEECVRCVGLSGSRSASQRMPVARFGVSLCRSRSELFSSSTVACECAGVSPITFTGVSVSSVNRTSSNVCVSRIASGPTRSRRMDRQQVPRASDHEPAAGLSLYCPRQTANFLDAAEVSLERRAS